MSFQFGVALWAIDVGLKAATMNYSAIFLHTREYGVQYNLFDPPTPDTSTSPGWRTGSPYYSALFLAEVTDPSGSVVADLDLNNSTTNQYATIAGYGIYDSKGSTRDRLVFLNYGSPDSEGDNATEQFGIPENITDQIKYRILTAPDVTEKSAITWAGQTVGPNGDLQGVQETITMNCEHGCLIDVPGPGAVIIWLNGDTNIFTGNSTIAPYQDLSDDAIMKAGSPTTFTLLTAVIGLITLFS
jgi:hypothetical protein